MKAIKNGDPKKKINVNSLLKALEKLSSQPPKGSSFGLLNQFRGIKPLLDEAGSNYASDAAKASENFTRQFLTSAQNRKLTKEALLNPNTDISKISDFMSFKGGVSPIDKIIDYKKSMMDINPVITQTPPLDPDNLRDPVLYSKKAWRPRQLWDVDGDVLPERVAGMVQPASLHGKSSEKPYNKPFIMGLPESFQSRYKPADALLHESPEQLKQTVTHERAHTLDLPNTPLKESVVSRLSELIKTPAV